MVHYYIFKKNDEIVGFLDSYEKIDYPNSIEVDRDEYEKNGGCCRFLDDSNYGHSYDEDQFSILFKAIKEGIDIV